MKTMYAIINEGLKDLDLENDYSHILEAGSVAEIRKALKALKATDKTHTIEIYKVNDAGDFVDGSDFDTPSNFLRRTSPQRKAADKYDAENMKKVTFKFHLRSDKDILDKLASVPNKAEYIRSLIRADIQN